MARKLPDWTRFVPRRGKAQNSCPEPDSVSSPNDGTLQLTPEQLVNDERAELSYNFVKLSGIFEIELPIARQEIMARAFLVCLANEIISKAILAEIKQKEYTEKRLRRFGHNLVDLHAAIKKEGIELSAWSKSPGVSIMNFFYQEHFIKYPNIHNALGSFDAIIVHIWPLVYGTYELHQIYRKLADGRDSRETK
jgi:hypothetical protein